MVKLVDSHCHLESIVDLDRVILDSKSRISALITTGYDYQSSLKALEMAAKYKNYVYPVIGLSPQKAMKQADLKMDIDLVRGNRQVRGIGEIGLDFHWAKTDEEKDLQRRAFSTFLDLALELDLPVVIHSRDAEEEMMRTLLDKKMKKVLLHCFSGNETLGKRAIENGYFISVPPMPSKSRKKMLKAVDLDFLVIESDAPAIGKEPLSIIKSAEIIANAKGIAVEEVERATTENAIKFFSLEI